MKKENKPLTKAELELLISLVRMVKSDIKSSKEVGLNVSENEEKKVSRLENRLISQLTFLSS